MTRLLCLGDTHIGAGAAYAQDRLADQEHVLEQIIDVARDREVDGVAIAGDVFDRPKPAPAELHAFARFARRLEQSAIPCVAVLGNAGHDQLGTDLSTALELFAHGDWMRVSRHPEPLKLAGVTVCTLPSVPVSRLVAQRGGRDDLNDLAVALLLEAAAEIRAQASDGPAVLLGHWSVTGASLPNGLPTSDLHEPVLPYDALEALGFDAMVFGHIHKPQDIGGDGGSGFYTGSPMTLNFGEALVDHGVWILDLTDGGYYRQFVPLDDRRFVSVDVDLTDQFAQSAAGLDETDLVAAAITLPVTDAVMRLRYRCTEEQARRVDMQALKDFCLEAGAHRVYQIAPEIVRATRARVQGVDEALAPQEALNAWLKAEGYAPDQPPHARLHGLLRDYTAEAVAA